MRVSRRGFVVGVLLEIEVVAGGESFGDALDLGIERRESAASGLDQLEGGDLDVALESRLADDLGVAAERLDVGVLELPEVVFALRPRRAEGDRRVGLAVDVRHAPLVAVDDDLAGESRVRRPAAAGGDAVARRDAKAVQERDQEGAAARSGASTAATVARSRRSSGGGRSAIYEERGGRMCRTIADGARTHCRGSVAALEVKRSIGALDYPAVSPGDWKVPAACEAATRKVPAACRAQRTAAAAA